MSGYWERKERRNVAAAWGGLVIVAAVFVFLFGRWTAPEPPTSPLTSEGYAAAVESAQSAEEQSCRDAVDGFLDYVEARKPSTYLQQLDTYCRSWWGESGALYLEELQKRR